MNLFGKKKKQAAPNATDAVQKLKDTQELLEKREAHLEQKINEELLKAKKLSKMKNKRGALMALKRKKMMEAQVDKLGATKMNLETQISALQNASMDMEVIQAMRSGASAMKVQYQNMNVENVEDVMDEIRDQMDVANEVSEAISQPLGGEMIDEDDLLGELDELEAEMLDEEMGEVESAGTALPSSGTKVPTAASGEPEEEDEEEALRKLEQSMAQ
uniref:Uncharacterized protein n=1 Tax=Palpitomonas bilix TaxID=652834 RepID=A0A7S3D4D4_9EUKA|mmetsp:Transcript_21578/g.56038  ORF Transcript_21578/g.56038 Transcript_21578/m.56038 type:complete len:217 (+) Transcript_21578:194-844(+)|eukprot:CAMPEP_0113902752 /NCGR_PEP_ID=MMETSP0780_2-20120614/22038_1 /TAXON_ID=652834 /ORGANISM="Palpitomonas bilix" /LENGTH=216 /DNA_ID=CAMNT_0000895619 /DNA_START=152 /DNA_END=802 /DNA_ORIENTATION=- /assembly_acc=CAM_ASM_000599